MKLMSTTNLTRTTVFLGFAAMVFACGKKSSSDPSPAPAPTPPAVVQGGAPNQASQLPPATLPAGQQSQQGQQGQQAQGSYSGSGSGSAAAPAPAPAPLPAVVTANQGGTTIITVPAGSSSSSGNTFVTGSSSGGSSGGESSSCSSCESQPPMPTIAATGQQAYLIGSLYTFYVPQTMHMTDYAYSSGFTNLAFWRVSAGTNPGQDPFYMQNYSCGSSAFDSTVYGGDAAGDVWNYCLTTIPSGNPSKVATIINGEHMAENHIEVVTDAKAVNGATFQTYIDVDLFDTNYPFHKGQSRFDYLCGSSNNIYVAQNVPVQYSFYGNPLVANVAACPVELATGSNGLPTVSPFSWQNYYWVVSYFLSATQFNTACYTTASTSAACTSYTNNSLLEVTIVSKSPYTNAPDAVQAAQATMFPITAPLLISNHP